MEHKHSPYLDINEKGAFSMRIKQLLCILVISLLMIGCSSSKKMNRISVGMTRDQVIEQMGKPHSTSAKDDVEFLNYKLASGSFFRDDYYVRLVDGQVDAYGRAGDFGRPLQWSRRRSPGRFHR